MALFWQKNKEFLIGIILFAVALFFVFYKITESPPTWMDEGIIINSARVFAENGRFGLQIAPNHIESAEVLTTNYPVTLPLALVFDIFGVGLLQARLVMAGFILVLFALCYLIIRRSLEGKFALVTLAFLILLTFPPIYGQGKNVLGEVPAVLYLLAFLFFADYYKAKNDFKKYLFASLFAALAVATKPVFVLFIPAFLVALAISAFWGGHKISLLTKEATVSLLLFLVVVAIWPLSQFSFNSALTISSLYFHPGNVNLLSTVFDNIKILFSESQPFYFLALLVVWTIAFLVKLRKGLKIGLGESALLALSWLLLLNFLRVPAYYRYFFPAEFFGLLYLIPNLLILAVPKKVIMGLVALLIILSSYSLIFTSWTARAYNSKRTFLLENYFHNLGATSTVFLYQAPELATFAKKDHYYQFFYAAPNVAVGSSSLPYLQKGLPDILIKHSDQDMPAYLLAKYKKTSSVSIYDILIKTQVSP